MKRVMPPTYFFILLVLAIGLHFVFPIMGIVPYPFQYLGLAFIVFGIIMNLWTNSLFGKKTTVKPH